MANKKDLTNLEKSGYGEENASLREEVREIKQMLLELCGIFGLRRVQGHVSNIPEISLMVRQAAEKSLKRKPLRK